MKLIVGLGNPGKRYQTTRHNLGFMVLDKLLGSKGWRKEPNAKVVYKSKNKVLYIKPQIFMNRSGIPVADLVKTKKIRPDDILIIRDDIDLEFGKIRARKESSSSGHKGVRSILEALKLERIAQIKIGIGQDKTVDLDDYVISRFSTRESKLLPEILDRSADLVLKFITSSLNKREKFEDTSINVEGS